MITSYRYKNCIRVAAQLGKPRLNSEDQRNCSRSPPCRSKWRHTAMDVRMLCSHAIIQLGSLHGKGIWLNFQEIIFSFTAISHEENWQTISHKQISVNRIRNNFYFFHLEEKSPFGVFCGEQWLCANKLSKEAVRIFWNRKPNLRKERILLLQTL